MDRFASMFSTVFLFVSVATADQLYLYEISVRHNNGDVQTIEVQVLHGQVQQAGLEGNLQIEFSPVVAEGGNAATLVQLMRSSDLQVLHTARQSHLGVDVRRIAYVVCDDRVTFMSPTPKGLPTCEIGR